MAIDRWKFSLCGLRLFSIATQTVRKWHVSQTHNCLITLREPQGMHMVTGKPGSFQLIQSVNRAKIKISEMFFSGKDSLSNDSCRLIAPKTIFNPLFDTVLPVKLKRGVRKLNLFAKGLFDVKSSQEPGRRGFSQLRITKEHLHFRDEFRGKHVKQPGTVPQSAQSLNAGLARMSAGILNVTEKVASGFCF